MDEDTWTIGEEIIPKRVAIVEQGNCIREGIDKGKELQSGRQLQLGKELQLANGGKEEAREKESRKKKEEGKKEAREKRKILRSLRFRTKQSSFSPNLFPANNHSIPTIMGESWSKDQPKVNTIPVSRSPFNLWNGVLASHPSKPSMLGTDSVLSQMTPSALPLLGHGSKVSQMTPSALSLLGHASKVSKGFDPFEQEKYMTGLGLSPNGQRVVTHVPLEPLDLSSRSEEYGDHPLDLSIRSKGNEDSSSNKTPLDATCESVLIDDNDMEVGEDFPGYEREGSEDTRVKRGIFGVNVSKKFPNEDFNLDFDTSSDSDENHGKFESGIKRIVSSQSWLKEMPMKTRSGLMKRASSELELFNHINEPISVPECVCVVSRSGFPCDLCHLSFHSLSHLIIHEPCFYARKKSSGMNVSIGKQGWNFKCDIIGCHESFTGIQPMRHHLDLHFGLISCNYDAVSNLVDSLLKLVQPDAIAHFQHDFY